MKRNELLARMGIKLPMQKQVRVIVSSDVRNEADDQFAVAHHLLTPIFDVRAVVAAHYESKAPGTRTTMERSYEELLKLMEASGIEDVPALRGCDAPLSSEADAPECEGADFIIREALREDSRPLYIAAQGALTDVAAALNRRPEIAEKLTVIWIGGMNYPDGGPEFNLLQDVPAARAVFASKAAVWQLPVGVYGTVETSMAELAWKVRPCGTMGRYLYDEIEDYNLRNDEPYDLRKGETWSLGDSPAIAAMLECTWRGNFRMERAPYIRDDMTYQPDPNGKLIRVYDYVDVRMLLEDFFSKLALCYKNY